MQHHTVTDIREEQTHKAAFDCIFHKLANEGELVSPRGLLVKECENFSYVLPPYIRFSSYVCRKYNVNYFKREFLWYLRGDRFDTSICEHAKMWNDIKNDDGSINSNYGQYIWNKPTSQFDNVVHILTNDKDSRRASITILNSDHLLSLTKDVPCTYSLNFRIRNNVLKMSVLMRAQDAIWGMGNDAPSFSVIHEMVFNALKRAYPTLQIGEYFHYVNSFHVYERHFEMLQKIINGDEYIDIKCPKISGPDEVDFLRNLNYSIIPQEYEFTKWITKINTNN